MWIRSTWLLATFAVSQFGYSLPLTGVAEVNLPIPGYSGNVSNLTGYFAAKGNGLLAFSGSIGGGSFVYQNGVLYRLNTPPLLAYGFADEIDVAQNPSADPFVVTDGSGLPGTHFAGLAHSNLGAFFSSQAPPLPMPASNKMNVISLPRIYSALPRTFSAWTITDNNGGNVVSGVVLSTQGQRGVFVYGGMALPVPLNGQTIQTGQFGVEPDYHISDNMLHRAFLVNMTPSNQWALTNDPSALSGFKVHVRQGQPYAPAPALLHNSARQARINNSGTLVYAGSVALPPQTIFGVFVNNVIALGNLNAYGLPGYLPSSQPGALHLNNNNYVLSRFVSGLNDAFLLGRANPAAPSACLRYSRLILRTGQTYPYKTPQGNLHQLTLSYVSTYESHALDDLETMAFYIEGTDQTSVFRKAIIRIPREALADFDGDTEVGPSDYGTFLVAFGSMLGDPSYNSLCDLDFDGEIGPGDFALFIQAFGWSW